MLNPNAWPRLSEAESSIIGKPLTLLHYAGATERTTLHSKDEATRAWTNGWTRYLLDAERER